jgi:nucleoside-diphosphate-sugar epimerase
MVVVLGASGYLGCNILPFLGAQQTVTVSQASRLTGVRRHYQVKNWSAKNIRSVAERILSHKPSRLLIVARPPTLNYLENQRFYSEIKNLCLELVQDPNFHQIDFFSTTMVYEGTGLVRSASTAKTVPFSAYEYFKLDFELFLEYLCRSTRKDLSVSVYRLPLLFGGQFNPVANGNQVIYQLLRQYQNGNRWNFRNDSEKKYGTSWAYVPDLCASVAKKSEDCGYRVMNVASGFFTYHQLDSILRSLVGSKTLGHLELIRSRFQAVDNLDLPRRNIETVLAEFIHANNPKPRVRRTVR